MDTSDDQALRDRANELYWGSDESVNQIADELELSKGALYGLVEPFPSGLPCPRCGTEMEYPNRTARDKGYLTCPACELEEDEEIVRSRQDASSPASRGATAAGAPGRERAPGTAPNRMLLGSALLGVAAGAALAIWMRRR